MKVQFISLFIMIFTLMSCDNSQNNDKDLEKNTETSQLKSKQSHLNLEVDTDSILNKWFDYYKANEPSFSLANFHLTTTDSLRIMNANVFGIFDGEFDEIYDEFLIYNSDKSQYLDFDSYSWTIDENGEQSFSPDQEINLIDIENKTVTRTAFRGPSQWVEDAFWKNDSIIVLLENNYNKQPLISEINLKNGIVRNFKYSDTLNFETDYTSRRFKQKRAKNTIGINDQ